MGTKWVDNLLFETTVCNECGIVFAIPSYYLVERKGDHKSFYCPNGHSLYYPLETEEEKLKKKLSKTEKLLKEEQACCIQAHEQAGALERSNRSLKGVITKLKKGSKHED